MEVTICLPKEVVLGDTGIFAYVLEINFGILVESEDFFQSFIVDGREAAHLETRGGL